MFVLMLELSPRSEKKMVIQVLVKVFPVLIMEVFGKQNYLCKTLP